MGLEDAREDNLDMASQEEAVLALVAPGEEEVKKMESGGGRLVNGARMSSFNSGFTTDVVAGDFDMAQSQVAVAGSVDSAAEAPVSAGAEPSADVDTGPASSSDVVDSTKKVESWDLSEAVEESAGNKEESKPNFAEDGTLEYMKTQASSDLIADAPTSAASVQDSDGGVAVSVPSADVEEKAVDLSSEEAEVVSEELPAEVSASESVSPNFQDEGSAEKGESETPETSLEEVHEATEARNSAEADNEEAGVEAVLSPTADVEEKSDDVEDKLVDVEDEPADVQDKSVDDVDSSVEMTSKDARAESDELPAEVAASEEVNPETPDEESNEESAETGDSEAPEAPAEDVVEVAQAATSAEPDEDEVTLEASPSPFVDVKERPLELGSEVARALSVDISPKIEDEGSVGEIGESEASAPAEEVNEVAELLAIAEPLEAAPSPFVDVEEESFELDPGNGQVMSEDASPETEGEESAETSDSAVPEVHEVTEATTNAELDEDEATLETAPSPVVDVGEESVELDSEDAVTAGEDVSPEFEVVGSADKGDNDAPEVPVEEANEVAEAAAHVEPEETVASHEGVPSPSTEFGGEVVDIDDKSVDLADENGGIEDKSVEVSSGDVGAESEELPAEVAGSEEVSPTIADEESAERSGSEAAEAPLEEVHEVAEAATSTESDEDVATLEASPSPFVDVEEKSFELGSEVARALSVDASPETEAEGSAAEKGESEASALAEEVDEVAEPIIIAEPLEAAPSPFVDVEAESFELDPEVAPATSEDASLETEGEGSTETGDSEAPEALVEEVHDVAEAATSAEPDEDVATLEAAPSPFVDVGEKPFELGSAVARALNVDASPVIEAEVSTETGESEASAPAEEVAEPINFAEPLEAAPSPFVDVEEESFELDPEVAPAMSEDVSPETEGEGSAEIGDSEAAEAPVEEVHEVAEAATSAEPDEDAVTLESSPSPFVDVEEKSFELGSDVARALSVDASPETEAEGSAAETGESEASTPVEEVNEVAEPITIAEPLETAPSPFVDVEAESFELDPEVAGAVNEDVSPETENEGSVETGDSEAAEAPAEEDPEVAEAAASAEPDEDMVTLEASPSPFIDVERKSFELDSDVARAFSVDASPETEAEGSAKTGDSEAPEAPAEDVGEVAEPLTIAEPLEAAPSPFVDVEEESFELDPGNGRVVSEDVSPETEGEEFTETGDLEAPEAPPEEDHEVAEAGTAELDEDEATLEATPMPSVDVGEKSVEVEPEDSIANPEAHEASATLDSVPPSAADVDDSFVQEVDSNDTSEAREVSPSKSDEEEDRSLEPPAEGAADVVGSETRYVPDEDVHEVVEATISGEPGEGPESALAPSDVAEERAVDLSSEDAIGATTASESVDKEDVSPEPSIEATTSAGADVSLESGDVEDTGSLESRVGVSLESGDVEGSGSLESLIDEGSAILESMPSPATDVQDDPAADVQDGPADGSADKVGSETLFTPVEEVHEVVESTITAESDNGSTILESGPARNDGEEKPEELSKETIAELPSENNHDLSVEEVPAPIEETEKTPDGAIDAEPAVLESTASLSEDVTVSRESNFDDLKEALPISEDKFSGKVATAIGEEEGSSVDEVSSDTTSLETSTAPPAAENAEAQRSYDLHEVAVHLEDAAEKTLEDVKSSDVGDGKASYSESVAHIVLDERSKTDNSSELISGVIQHVAQLAQDDFQSDPNVLPDTVNQVFDRGAAGSRANDASQPKENTSLGTKFSLFVIWCISLCASHVSSKSMPAPALKLGAEEVAAVLHSNAQGAASSQAASSV